MNNFDEFTELGISSNILNALKKKGFEKPSPIQKEIIPLLMKSSKNIIGQSQTGTGKTAAFGIPIIEKITPHQKHIQALILVPTRELALQVAEEINSLKGTAKLTIIPMYGGQGIEGQIRNLQKGVDILVGTPGRLLDLLERKKLFLHMISYLVLDEADKMLDMGFIDDIEMIFQNTNKTRQVLLFSATMPPEIKSIAHKYMGECTHIAIKSKDKAPSLTEQIYFEVNKNDKFEVLCRIIDIEQTFYAIIFCRTKVDVDMLSSQLIRRGYSAMGMHGDLSQAQREKILLSFRNKRTTILVATDVAARGIDISNLTHVINYSLPQDPESYIHRIGRTGRAGKEGTAITFVTPEEYQGLLYIQRMTKTTIQKKKIPHRRDIIAAKKARITEDINAIIATEKHKNYKDLADTLLEHHDAQAVIAALIHSHYGDELLESSYTQIKDTSIDIQGRARLFVALGTMDGITEQKLIQYVASEGNIPPHLIRDIRIYEKFSFITVPFLEAEHILQEFQKNKKRRPLIEKAKEVQTKIKLVMNQKFHKVSNSH